jgi:hypothetical protein
MKTITMLLAISILIIGLIGFCSAADNDNHQVTVTVSAINELALTGGNITLTINTATAGSEPTDDTDATCTLAWTTNEASKKVTVVSSLAAPTYTLKVEATGVTGGTAAAQLTLTNAAQDFVTAVATTTGGCTLSYTAQATAAQGTGSDVHTTVTYTVTAA